MALSTTDTALYLDPEIVALLPRQGEWTENDYLWLTDHTNRLVELTDGSIEVLPMPIEKHQLILAYLYRMFFALMEQIQGKVLFAALRMRVGPDRFREPDLLLVCDKDDPRAQNRYWEGADLVVEIVSPGDPERDYKVKREDYARAGVLEYWIVDPQQEKIVVLRLADTVYEEHGVFACGTTVASALFPDVKVSVDAVLDA